MKFKKRAFILLILLVFAAFLPGLSAHAEPAGYNEEAASQSVSDYKMYMPQDVLDEIAQTGFDENNFQSLSLSDVIAFMLTSLKNISGEPAKLFVAVAAILILCAALNLFNAEAVDSPINTVETVIAIILFIMLCRPLLALCGQIIDVVLRCKVFILSFVPAFVALIVASGQPAQAVVYNSFFMGALVLFSELLSNVFTPLIQVFIAFSITASFSKTFNLSAIAAAIYKFVKWSLALLATLFTAILGLQSVIANAGDNFAVKTGKFLISGGVPVIGSAVADAFSSVYAGLRLMKGASGLACIAVIFSMFLPVLLQCLMFGVVIQGTKLIAGVAGNKKADELLNSFSQCVGIYISVILFFFMIIIISITLMLALNGGA